MYKTDCFEYPGWFCNNIRFSFSYGNRKVVGEEHLALLSSFFSGTLRMSRYELLTYCTLLMQRTEVILEKKKLWIVTDPSISSY